MDEYKKKLKLRLSTLYDDVNLRNTQAADMLAMISEANCDRDELFNNIYFKNNSPLKIMNYYFHPVVKGDITEEMLNISSNFDMFLREMYSNAKKILDQHAEAVTLLLVLLSLPRPYCEVMYFRHYKMFTREEIMSRLFLSRSSYYRIYDDAFNMILEKLQEGVRA